MAPSPPPPPASGICHLVDPEPTANLGLGSHTLKRPHLACGQGPGNNGSAVAGSRVSAGSGSVFQHSVGWSNCEAPNTVW